MKIYLQRLLSRNSINDSKQEETSSRELKKIITAPRNMF